MKIGQHKKMDADWAITMTQNGSLNLLQKGLCYSYSNHRWLQVPLQQLKSPQWKTALEFGCANSGTKLQSFLISKEISWSNNSRYGIGPKFWPKVKTHSMPIYEQKNGDTVHYHRPQARTLDVNLDSATIWTSVPAQNEETHAQAGKDGRLLQCKY